jgi:hypothetical protein
MEDQKKQDTQTIEDLSYTTSTSGVRDEESGLKRTLKARHLAVNIK